MAELTSWTPRQKFAYSDGDDELRIGVLGSYGGLNVGDEAILRCVLGCIRHVRPFARVVVFSRNEEHTRQHHDGVSEVWAGKA